ncbi:hypothetical protein DAMA08_024840 [Martiniozyma asiatica (nom. inval.)]|nr:hypothetical protein DAMA08_024840 [Martiniozyma asiatica]
MFLKLVASLTFLICLSSYKTLPFVYEIRFWLVPFRYLIIPCKKSKLANSPFQKFSRSTYCSPFECDFFGFHKTNSSYFTELSIARTETVLVAMFEYFKSLKKLTDIPFIPLAEVECSFLKEISPFQKYDVVCRIAGMGEKWVWILSVFVVKAQGNHNAHYIKHKGSNWRVCAVAVSKIIFKKGRKTLSAYNLIGEEYKAKAIQGEEEIIQRRGNAEKLLELWENLDKI